MTERTKHAYVRFHYDDQEAFLTWLCRAFSHNFGVNRTKGAYVEGFDVLLLDGRQLEEVVQPHENYDVPTHSITDDRDMEHNFSLRFIDDGDYQKDMEHIERAIQMALLLHAGDTHEQ